MDILNNLFGFATGLLGACVGGIFILWGSEKTIRADNLKEERREEKEIQNLLDALGVEIGTLWEFHLQRVGGMVERLQPGEALEFFYPLTQDYFTVYDANARIIGRVRDPELRKAVVVTYNKCKKVVDGFKYNNELFRTWRDAVDASEDHPSAKVRIDKKFKDLVEYAPVIREDHFELKKYVGRLLELLEHRT